MIPFLKGVAEAYLSIDRHLLQHYCFLFPNKRSAAFFQKYLKEGLPVGETLLAPRIVTVTDFMESVSGLTVDSHLDLLLTLYDSYLSLLQRKEIAKPSVGDSDDSLPEFDSFVRWGETVLNDFNDVDLFSVNHEMVFRNVKDFRSISTDYLTDAQKEVMREYFNIEPSLSEAEHFWEHYPDKRDKGSGRFRLLWEILHPLYMEFSSRLLARGLATQGMAARRTLEVVREKGSGAFPFSKIVAVGFNVLTVAEYEIFLELSHIRCDRGFEIGEDDKFADFFWDATGPVLGETGDAESSASRFVRHNIRKFPAPTWAMPYLELTFTDSLPETLESISAPSNSLQAKIASDVVEREIVPLMPLVKGRMDNGEFMEKPDFSAANVAVVLPDEALLFPLLYSLPPDVDINLTMGYPLRQTPALSFVALLRRLLSRRRLRSDGKIVFYKPELLAFLAHPFVAAYGGIDSVRSLSDWLAPLRVSEVCFQDIVEDWKPVEKKQVGEKRGEELEKENGDSPLISLLGEVMSLPRSQDSPTVKSVLDTLTYIEKIMVRIKRGLWGASRDVLPLASRMDVAQVDVYIEALSILYEAVAEHKIPMSENTALYLADRLIGAEKVEFEGEPLAGLQVIGLLETRGLDFEYIVIPSLNERIFPRKTRSRSFIPDVLRNAYGMPPSNYQESLFSYYFYRMISRARRVWMIHDARMSTGGRNGEPSRYLAQLRHLYAPGLLRERECSFVIPGSLVEESDIEKTDVVMKALDSFKRIYESPTGPDSASTSNFSASTLRHYLTCPVKFYYQDVAGLREKDVFSEDIDAISLGNVFHKVMEQLYPKANPSAPKLVTPDFIQSILDDGEGILQCVRRAVATEHFKLKDNDDIASLLEKGMSGGVEMVAIGIADNVRRVLRHDLSLAPFTILGSELKETFAFPVTPSEGEAPFNVNMKFAIDRLDLVTVVEGKGKETTLKERLRIVDYKTGSVHLTAEDFGDIFSPAVDSSNIFQLMLYARMLGYWREYRGFSSDIPQAEIDDPAMEIYEVSSISEKSPRVLPKIGEDGNKPETVWSYSRFGKAFERRLAGVLAEIFNPSEPFRHTPDKTACTYCHLRDLCRR